MTHKVLVIAAGTGGHIFPALAVVRALQRASVECIWLGTFQGMEARIVTREGIPLEQIQVKGLRGKGWIQGLAASFQLIKALIDSLKIIRRVNPDIVLAMGGFVSGPSGLAAKLLRKKLILHEQNAVPGITNKILACIADKILTGFPKVFSDGRETPVIYTGNPIRDSIERVPEPENRFEGREGPIRLLVFGGSQGSVSFNQAIPKAIALFPREQRPIVWHQSGRQYFEMADQAYREADVEVRMDPFVDDMAEAYRWADLVICRSGAVTVAELVTVGLAAILIPYPYHVDEQQKHNAQFLSEAGAAVIMTHQELMAGDLKSRLEELFASREKLLAMAKAGRALRKESVAQSISSIVQCSFPEAR